MGCCSSAVTPLDYSQTLGDFIDDLQPVGSSCSCGTRSQESYYSITMDEYGYSSGQPLYTYGAGPCLIVVVHETRRKVGCLAHVYNAGSRFPAVLSSMMLKSVGAMMDKIGTTDVTVYLAAGGAYGPPGADVVPDLPFIHEIPLYPGGQRVRYDASAAVNDLFGPPLAAFLRDRYNVRTPVVDRRNCAVAARDRISQLAYWPAQSRVLRMTADDLTYVRRHQLAKGANVNVGHSSAANRVIRVFDGNREQVENAPDGPMHLPNAIFPIKLTDNCQHWDDGGPCRECSYPCPVCGDNDALVARPDARSRYRCSECRQEFEPKVAAPARVEQQEVKQQEVKQQEVKQQDVQLEVEPDPFDALANRSRIEIRTETPAQPATSASALASASAAASSSSAAASTQPSAATTSNPSSAPDDDWEPFR